MRGKGQEKGEGELSKNGDKNGKVSLRDETIVSFEDFIFHLQ